MCLHILVSDWRSELGERYPSLSAKPSSVLLGISSLYRLWIFDFAGKNPETSAKSIKSPGVSAVGPGRGAYVHGIWPDFTSPILALNQAD